MSRETCRTIAGALERLAREQARPFVVVLHGGEPLLLGAANLDYLFLALREALPTQYGISIQTNGILISREILDLCAAARVSLSVSLDGPKHVHDRYRVGFTGGGTFDKVLDGIGRLRGTRIPRLSSQGCWRS